MRSIVMTIILVLATVNHAQLEPYVLNIKYDTKTYLLYFKTFATNTDANTICTKQGGSLVNIFGAEVHRQIFASMKTLIGTHFFNHDNVVFNETWSYWISPFTPRLNMNYYGSKFERFTNWYFDVLGPTIGSDYNGGANSYGCPDVLLGTESGYWGVAPCNRKMPFVCEIPKEDGKIETDNAIYSIYIQQYTRDKAQALCNFTGGHLPYIKNEDENTLLSSTFREYQVGTKSGAHSFWIGVVNATADYKQWSYDDGSKVSYTNWQNGKLDINEWNLDYYQSMNMCVSSGTENMWYLVRCDYDSISFVCQYDKTKQEVNLTRIEQWASTHELFNRTTSIIYNQVNSTHNITTNTYIDNHTNIYNSTTVIENNIANDTFYNFTTVNKYMNNHTMYNSTSFNVENTTGIANNYTSLSYNTTYVYDRKMMMGRDNSDAIFWTLIGIGSFMVVLTCIMICICVSCWCVYR